MRHNKTGKRRLHGGFIGALTSAFSSRVGQGFGAQGNNNSLFGHINQIANARSPSELLSHAGNAFSALGTHVANNPAFQEIAGHASNAICSAAKGDLSGALSHANTFVSKLPDPTQHINQFMSQNGMMSPTGMMAPNGMMQRPNGMMQSSYGMSRGGKKRTKRAGRKHH